MYSPGLAHWLARAESDITLAAGPASAAVASSCADLVCSLQLLSSMHEALRVVEDLGYEAGVREVTKACAAAAEQVGVRARRLEE